MARAQTHPQTGSPWVLALFALVFGAALIAGFMSPGVYTQTQSVDAPALLIGGAGIVAIGSLVARKGVALSTGRAAIAWSVLVAWGLVAALASGRALAAFFGEPTNLLGWFSLAALAAVVWACAVHADAARDALEIVAPWVLALQLALVFLAIVQFRPEAGLSIDLFVRGTLPNSTALGELFVLLVPWTVAPQLTERMRLPLAARYAIAVLSLATLAIGQSRVALVMGLLWALWALLGTIGVRPAVRSRVTAAAIALTAVLAAVYVTSQLGAPLAGQLGLRPEFVRTSLAAAVESPLVGYGPDGFVAGGAGVSSAEFVSVESPLIFARGSVDPHNALAWVVVSFGFAGLALFIWALVETALGLVARRAADTATAPAAWGLGMFLVVILTAPATLAVLPVAAVTLGVALASRASAERPGWSRIGGWIALVVLGVSSALLAANMATRLPLERADATVSPALAERASRADAFWSADPYLAYLAYQHWGWSGVAVPGSANGRDLAAIERAVALDTRDPFVALELARTLEAYAADAGEIEAAYLETLRRWPLYPVARLQYAAFLLGQNRVDDARVQVDLVSGVNTGDPEFRALLEQVTQQLLSGEGS